MPRIIPPAAATEVAKKLGTEPIYIVEVYWGDAAAPTSPSMFYADKDFDGIPGKILKVSELDAIIKLGSTGATAELSITLDDTDGSIKTIIDTNDIHKNKVVVYQAYGSLTAADKFFLFEGKIETPIIYSEADRSISFDILTEIEDEEIGFSPEEEDLPGIAPDAIGVPWPLVFGSVLRVPAVKLTEQVRGTSLTAYGAVSLADLDNLCSRARATWDADLAKQQADLNTGFSDDNYAIVIDNLTSATISMNTYLESLIADSPTQEAQLIEYRDVCILLYQNERNKAFFGPLAVAIVPQIEVFEGGPGPPPFEGSIAEKQIEIYNEQNEYLINPSDQGLAFVQQLQAEYTALVNENGALNSLLQTYTVALLVANANILIYETEKLALENQIAVIVVNPIIVENGEKFPQGVSVRIVINNLHFQGTFSGRTFTVEEANLPAETNLPTAARQNNNANEFWVVDPTADLKGKYCKFPEGILYVNNQDQTRCYASPLLYSQTGELPPLAGILINGEPVIREIWDPILLGSIIQETSVFLRPSWVNQLNANSLPDFADGRSNLTKQDYSIKVGDTVYLFTDFKDIYVANLIPSTEVTEVMAFRTINGVRRLRPVPSRYFTINLSEAIAGQTSTTIRFHRPLEQYIGEDWDDDIYVTLTSTEGPNTADIIAYIATTYTDLTPDPTTFAAVAAAIVKYPSHFPILDRPTALGVMERIAWQARCAVYAKQDTLFIKYLSVEDTEVTTITETEIQYETLEMTMTETDDLVTKFIAEWTLDHAVEEPNKVILRNNIPRYGKIEQTYDFFIYNVESLVVKSASFWMLRYSNTWKQIKFTGFLNQLELEVFDTVLLTLPNDFVGTGSIKGIVNKADYDSKDQSIEYEIWTSVRAGELIPYIFAWPSSSPIDTEYPTENDPFAGGAA